MLAAVFWGANYAATKYAAELMPPLLVMALRFSVGSVVMFYLLRILEPSDRLSLKQLVPVASLGRLYVAIGQATFTVVLLGASRIGPCT